jgi:glycosyltransferase involved in cell wall biosynthesis
VIAVNEQLRDLFVLQFGVPADRVRLIPPHALPSKPAVKLPECVEQFFANHDPVLLSMGWLEPEYDFPLQVRALGGLRERHPRAGLMLLGEGRLEHELRRQIEETNYASHVLMPGDLPHDVALAALDRCDILLRTTHYDGDSISVREALHFGTPVIASDNGMRPEGVRLIPARDLGALVSAIEAQLCQGRGPSREPDFNDANIQAVYELYRELE